MCSVCERGESEGRESTEREEIGPFFLRAHNQRSISVHSETENKLEVDWLPVPVVSVCWPIWPRILLVLQ